MSGSGREALPDVRKWSGGHRKLAGVVGRSTGCPGVFGTLSRVSRSWRESLGDLRE